MELNGQLVVAVLAGLGVTALLLGVIGLGICAAVAAPVAAIGALVGTAAYRECSFKRHIFPSEVFLDLERNMRFTSNRENLG